MSQLQILATCLGLWFSQNYLPSASAEPCPSLYVKNAQIDRLNSYAGVNATIKCIIGHRIKNSNATSKTVTCYESNGTWIDVPTECSPLHCPPTPDPPQNGRRSSDSTEYLTTVDYYCNYGHSFPDGKEDLTITCYSAGDWWPYSVIPPCSKKSCGAPPLPPANSSMITPVDWFYGSATVYTCKTGYWFERDIFSIQVHCDDRAQWYPELPSACSEVYCTPPPSRFPNGSYDNYDLIYGAVIRYQCNPGYVLRSGLGVETVSCKDDGKWDKEFPACIPAEPLSCYVCDHVTGCNDSSLVKCSAYEICYATYINQLVKEEWKTTHFHLRCAPPSYCPHEQDKNGHHCVEDGNLCHFCCQESGCNYFEAPPRAEVREEVMDFSIYYEYQKMLNRSPSLSIDLLVFSAVALVFTQRLCSCDCFLTLLREHRLGHYY